MKPPPGRIRIAPAWLTGLVSLACWVGTSAAGAQELGSVASFPLQPEPEPEPGEALPAPQAPAAPQAAPRDTPPPQYPARSGGTLPAPRDTPPPQYPARAGGSAVALASPAAPQHAALGSVPAVGAAPAPLTWPKAPGAPAAAGDPAQDSGEPAGSDGDESLKSLGLMLDGGLPDGAMLSAVYRPLSWVRLHGGGGSNTVSVGLRAGVALIPFGIGPSLTVEAGHYFEGNANGVAATMAGPSYEDTAVLDRVGYDFANAHLGLDFGRETFVFYIHGGMSYIRTQLHQINELLAEQGANDADSSTTLAINGDPTISGFMPSFKLGIVTYLL